MRTPRLEIAGAVLRPWELDDAGVLVAAWHDDDVAAFNAVPPEPSLATARRWIEGVEARASARLSLDWVIEHTTADGPQVVGEVGLSGFSDKHAGALIGYWLLPEGRGQGLATAAVQAVTAWAHESLKLATIVARCHTSNTASQSVAARSGFRNERTDSSGYQLWISRPHDT